MIGKRDKHNNNLSLQRILKDVLGNNSVNVNQKYHKKEMNLLLMEVMPKILPQLFNSTEVLSFLQLSFRV
jgi:hypothetical protein